MKKWRMCCPWCALNVSKTTVVTKRQEDKQQHVQCSLHVRLGRLQSVVSDWQDFFKTWSINFSRSIRHRVLISLTGYLILSTCEPMSLLSTAPTNQQQTTNDHDEISCQICTFECSPTLKTCPICLTDLPQQLQSNPQNVPSTAIDTTQNNANTNAFPLSTPNPTHTRLDKPRKRRIPPNNKLLPTAKKVRCNQLFTTSTSTTSGLLNPPKTSTNKESLRDVVDTSSDAVVTEHIKTVVSIIGDRFRKKDVFEKEMKRLGINTEKGRNKAQTILIKLFREKRRKEKRRNSPKNLGRAFFKSFYL